VPISLAAGPEIVAIPGPTVVPARVQSAMHRSMPDIYAGELLTVTDEVYDLLPGLARTVSRGFITISNGHGAWAMSLSNTLSRGDLVLVLECGRFAAVWAEMAEFDGLRAEIITADDGSAIDPAVVAERLSRDTGREIKAILMVHTDTASSARNDVPAIRAVLDAADHPALLMVDCIATMGCERFEMDAWGVDVVVAASQKGLMTPPGLGFVWAGPRALSAHQTAGLRTRYWDWTFRTEQGPHYLRFCGTPPVAHLFGFREALRMIEEEGLEARWQRHTALAHAVHAAVDAWSVPDGLSLHVPRAEQRGDSVTAIRSGSIDSTRLAAICRDLCGVTLGVGLGDLAGRAFRIGHMGHVNAPMVLGVLGVVESALQSMGAPVGGSGVAAASASLGTALTPPSR
jgi:alanine-glyoxylate transaminase/serine-glyoxylate transaminase/serine-pyruvate transaminase